MAEVYLAEQSTLRRKVAVKVLRHELAGDQTYVARFQNEAQAAASLVHANIVQIHEVGQVAGIRFIAQEYVAGRNLGQVIRRQGPLSAPLAIAILKQVAAALAKASAEGIVHRDIKPENIMLSRHGEVKVADFGLARLQGNGAGLTQVGVTMGTPLYMSPEQIEGKPLDARSDIYSLGVTAYHMLAGRPPFDADTPITLAMQHLNAQPVPLDRVRPELPAEVCQTVHRMMAKEADQRFASARELLAQMRNWPGDRAEADWRAALADPDTAEVALDAEHFEATRELGELMKTATGQQVARRRLWSRLAAACGACLLAGAAIAWLMRPDSVLADARLQPIPKRGDVWAQLLHAKRSDSEAAWLAVAEHFPQEAYAIQLARQGLARHYVQQLHDLDRAGGVLDEMLTASSGSDRFAAFAIAGKAIVASLQGRQQEARELNAKITPEMRDLLDPDIRQALQRELSDTSGKK